MQGLLAPAGDRRSCNRTAVCGAGEFCPGCDVRGCAVTALDGLLSCHRWRGADPVVSAASTGIPAPLTSDADAGHRATDRRRAGML